MKDFRNREVILSRVLDYQEGWLVCFLSNGIAGMIKGYNFNKKKNQSYLDIGEVTEGKTRKLRECLSS